MTGLPPRDIEREAGPVELITYASRLGGDLGRLREVMAGPLAGLFGGIHILPFYTPFDGADAGFDPQDHTAVDPRLGSWDDIAALARDGYSVMADVIVNHVSATAPQFQTGWPGARGRPTTGCS